MNSQITATFIYTENDIARGERRHGISQLRWPRLISNVLRFGALGALFWFLHNFLPWLQWFALLCWSVAVGCAGWPILHYWRPMFFARQRWSQAAPIEHTLTFTDEGVTQASQDRSSTIPWSMYRGAIVDRYSCLLYHGHRDYTLIPRRAFAGGDHERDFMHLITSKIRRIESSIPFEQ